MLTSDDLAARTDRAVAAAVDAGRGLGLVVTDPRVLYDMFSVVVHLWPAPVVVRVPTVVPRTVIADPDTQAAQQRREGELCADFENVTLGPVEWDIASAGSQS